tara:strand:+ start:265 stop:426 length:162 start_codon:yes stop_codon:yes gene_type:complete
MKVGDLVQCDNGKQGRIVKTNICSIKASAEVEFIDGTSKIFTGAQYRSLKPMN